MTEKKPNVKLKTISFLGKSITINERYEGDFVRADNHIRTYAPHLLAYINRIDSYNPRYIRFAVIKIWSYHAYGQAIDINPLDFPARISPNSSPYELPVWYQQLILLLKNFGFRSGSDWTNPYDPMHFEIGNRNG